MRENVFCTIVTNDYFFYCQALYDSIEKTQSNFLFYVLVVDEFNNENSQKNLKLVSLGQLKQSYANDYEIIKSYEVDKRSNLRWALKPLFLKYLLEIKSYDKAIFVDPDICFYNDSSFLFDSLKDYDVIITPHWRSKDPYKDSSNFDSLFTGGLFNAGFFGCTKGASNILNWWLKVCGYKMEKKDGFYVDQGYLNLMPIYFSSQVKIIEHKGCNVSNWNMVECSRTKVDDKVLINERYPIVFIHYTKATIKMIEKGIDNLLFPYLETYKGFLERYNPGFDLSSSNEIKTERKNPLILKFIRKVFR